MLTLGLILLIIGCVVSFTFPLYSYSFYIGVLIAFIGIAYVYIIETKFESLLSVLEFFKTVTEKEDDKNISKDNKENKT